MKGHTDMHPTISLKAARVNVGLTQDEAAEKIGKTKQTIVNWENGVTEIKYRDLITLSEIYEMPLEYIRLPERRKE